MGSLDKGGSTVYTLSVLTALLLVPLYQLYVWFVHILIVK